MEKMKIKNEYGFIQEESFVPLQNQIINSVKTQAKTDAKQTNTIEELNERLSLLESIVLSQKNKETIQEIENLTSGQTLSTKFLADVELTSKEITIKANTNVELDLNDKAIRATTPKLDAIIVESGATLTINGNGLVEAANDGNGFTIITDGHLIINGGNFVSGYDENQKANACIYARGNGMVEIYGGRFQTSNGDFVLNIKDSDRATASIKVMGGEFVNFDPHDNKSEGNNTNFVADGYGVESHEEGDNIVYTIFKL